MVLNQSSEFNNPCRPHRTAVPERIGPGQRPRTEKKPTGQRSGATRADTSVNGDFVLADTSVRSLRKVFTFTTFKRIYWIESPSKKLHYFENKFTVGLASPTLLTLVSQ